MSQINFSEYALQYDYMAKNNPAYIEIEQKVLSIFSSLIKSDNYYLVGDFGAGTGNHSVLLKKKFPNIKVIGLEKDEQFIQKYKRKVSLNGLNGILIAQADLSYQCIKNESLDAIIMIHVLAVLPDREKAIENVFNSLKKGGHLVVFDIGRQLNLLDWALYMARESLKRNGLINTLRLFYHTRYVRKQNRNFAKAQKKGLIEINTLHDFKKLFSKYNFKIIEESDKYYRGLDNYLLLEKSI